MRDSDKIFIQQNIDIFCCPACGSDLTFETEEFKCTDCDHPFTNTDGIPSLFSTNDWDPTKVDVTEKMKSFYEETPFPNYDGFDNVGVLIEKARRGLFAKLLDDQVPFGTRVLECGCGTGQLSNFLSIANRTVIGSDMCMNSLGLAHGFKEKNDLERVHFFQMNLFRPAFKPESFHLVISNGVLHHTSDPFLAFKTISRLVKPGGYILIGLYHKYGRLITDTRRIIFNLTRDRFKGLDPRTISDEISAEKRNAWFQDQYKNPHESKHTFGEFLNWLDEIGFTFVSSLPKTVPFDPIDPSSKLFQQIQPGNWFQRFLVEMGMIFTGSKEGGFFIVIARKPEK